MFPIEVINLKKMYGNTIGTLDVSFNVHEGEIVGFIGPNGAGKSTTIKAILGLIKPTSGKTTIFGVDAFKNGDIKKEVGYVPSSNALYENMTAIDNFKLVAKLKGRGMERVKDLATRLDFNVSRRVKELSFGNKKKAIIIAALMSSPKLIILDEPTSGLDPIIQQAFFDILREENARGATILLSSHILSEVQKICNKIVVIKQGKILTVEQMDTLRAKHLKEITFETNYSTSPLLLNGASNIVQQGKLYSFEYNGEIKKLMDYLSATDIFNITISDCELEKVFMHYYE
ncbi:MAG: ABC transporter ATP-binding protein [Clostridia bacterium]|jgi:ABC-2 type transport system ATP-binding protein|nr:ABC transporter ATP-binding protein [Clostridia bacterium]MDD4275519.1 ABC transporter ATP-binding protein [Clostridia bacterium]